MIISLIGLSGSGKTTLARNLADKHGFVCLSCDELIEEALEPELASAGGSGTGRLAKWLGQPFEKGFSAHQERYIECEARSMHEIARAISEEGEGREFVIDTTGSFVYLPNITQAEIAGISTIVYLETPADDLKAMFEQYLKDPKPVIWGDMYRPRSGESQRESLGRCYRDLVELRQRRYAAIADVTIPYSLKERLTLDSGEILRRIKSEISKH